MRAGKSYRRHARIFVRLAIVEELTSMA